MVTALAHTEPHLSEALARAIVGDTGLDPSQRHAVAAWINAVFWSYEDSFIQHRAGTLDAASFETDAATLNALAASPRFRVQWNALRALSAGAYREYVDRLIAETRAVKPNADAHAQWQAQMAEEIANAV